MLSGLIAEFPFSGGRVGQRRGIVTPVVLAAKWAMWGITCRLKAPSDAVRQKTGGRGFVVPGQGEAGVFLVHGNGWG
jgi:hypothetical protein